jgi:dihydrofolate reductase
MGRIVVSEWMSLDGVFDAASMGEWFNPFHSDKRAAWIRAGIDACESMLYGRVTYQMLAPYWSALKNNEMGVAAKLNGVKKYVVSATLEKDEWGNSSFLRTDAVREIARSERGHARDRERDPGEGLARGRPRRRIAGADPTHPDG